jgi:hypothetical protein
VQFRYFVISSSFIALALAIAAPTWLAVSSMVRAGPAIDHEALNAINLGMSQAEVERIIGGPPGDYARGLYGVMRFT